MKFDRSGTQLSVSLTGPIGETCGLFSLPLRNESEIILDLAEVTYINSIGVKNWIIWTLKIPKACKVTIRNAPFVIATQASVVMGFLTPNMKFESILVPYHCEDCNFEKMYKITRGKEFEYASPGVPRKIQIKVNEPCPKCGKATLEPDFFIEKTFKFLG